MSICRPVSRSICRDVIFPIFGGRVEDIDVVLTPVTLVSGETTAAEQTLIEAQMLTYNILNLLKSDHSRLRRRSQITLDSATAVSQYKELTQTISDFTASDIRYANYTWHGEHASDAAAGNASSVNTLYFNTTDLTFRGVSSNSGGITVWANFNQNTGLTQPTTWLSGLSDTEIESYFDTNTYDASRNYFVYQSSSGQVRKLTLDDTWSDLASDAEFDGVTGSELTQDTTNLLGDLDLDVSLSLGAIEVDINDTFRTKVDLVSGTTTYSLFLPHNLQNVTFYKIPGFGGKTWGTTDRKTWGILS